MTHTLTITDAQAVRLQNILSSFPFSSTVNIGKSFNNGLTASSGVDLDGLLDVLDALKQRIVNNNVNADKRTRELTELKEQRDAVRRFFGTDKQVAL